jgi:hypothetical protein
MHAHRVTTAPPCTVVEVNLRYFCVQGHGCEDGRLLGKASSCRHVYGGSAGESRRCPISPSSMGRGASDADVCAIPVALVSDAVKAEVKRLEEVTETPTRSELVCHSPVRALFTVYRGSPQLGMGPCNHSGTLASTHFDFAREQCPPAPCTASAPASRRPRATTRRQGTISRPNTASFLWSSPQPRKTRC